MNRTAIATLSAGVAITASAQVIEPKGSVQNLANIEVRNAIEGIHSHRFDGNTVRFTRVEADPGARSPDHNHANEQFLFLQSGSLRCFLGNDEYLLVPGDVVWIPAYVRHHMIALEESVWLEAHGPGF
ncbi:MAG: cupin domain-containing protein [Gammaproteobacteria bacterium]|nr:cupin domain-containing protein [Gammaproteobacteria bacterium]